MEKWNIWIIQETKELVLKKTDLGYDLSDLNCLKQMNQPHFTR